LGRRLLLVAVLAALLCTLAWGEVEQRIVVEGKGPALLYREELVCDERTFEKLLSRFLEDKEGYLESVVSNFTEIFLKLRRLKAINWTLSFNASYTPGVGARYVVAFSCIIHGAAMGRIERPTYAFEWLLIPLSKGRLDLYDFRYVSERELVYEGRVGRRLVSISLRFERPIAHCRYHVWYRG